VNLISVSTATGVGALLNSGEIHSNGGNATVSGVGGPGGSINFHAHGAVKHSAYLMNVNGGNSVGPGNAGGNGGTVFIEAAVPVTSTGEQLAVQPIQISGSLSLKGGTSNGSNGGQGGYLQILQDMGPALNSSSVPLSEGGIYLFGYARADLSAGNGAVAGGSATSNTAFGNNAAMEIHTYSHPLNNGSDAAAGPIIMDMSMAIRGGNASNEAGTGGSGGSMIWDTNSSANIPGSTGATVVKNTGQLDLSGGSGGSGGGGSASGLTIRGDDGVTNSGAILAKGGVSSGGTGGAGALNSVMIESSGDISNTAQINAAGGSGASGGAGSSSGFGGGIHLLSIGGRVATPGSLIANGGSGTSASGVNGDGGTVDLGLTTRSWGTIQVFAGKSAGAPGTVGSITIDGQPYQPL
jgi:hypothetical protein